MEDGILASPEFWVAVSFVLFMAFALWKLTRPMLNALDGRAARIKGEIDEAQRLREEAQHLLAEYKRKQRDARQEAEDMLRHAEVETKRLAEQAERDIEAALARRQQQALDRIAHAEAQALDQVRAQAVDLAVAATRRLLEDGVDEKKAGELIDQAIKNLSEKLH